MGEIDQGKKKLINFLDNFIDSDYFQKRIIKIRREFKIPDNGIKPPKRIINSLEAINIPKKIRGRKALNRKLVTSQYMQIVNKLPIDGLKIKKIINIYLYYNIKNYEILMSDKEELDVCRVHDILGEINSYSPLLPKNRVMGQFKYGYEKYPVVIKIHPDATQRDIISYIKTYWEEIDSCLSHYKGKKTIGSVRTKNALIKERNDFIYKNRDLPYWKICTLVADNFPGNVSNSINEGSIGKIISLEIKRRKEV